MQLSLCFIWFLRAQSFYQQDVSAVDSKHVRSCNPVNIEESFISYKSTSPYVDTQSGKAFRSSSNDEIAIASGLAASTGKLETDVSGNRLHKHNAAHLKLHASGDEYDVSATGIVPEVNVSDTGVYFPFCYLDTILIVIFY